MSHLKRLRAPRFWKVKKKETKWVVSPRPGPHKKFESIPTLVLVRDILKLADTAKEAKTITKSGNILIDKKIRKDEKYPLGFMDSIEIPKLNKYYRVSVNKHGLNIIDISSKESELKLCKIISKTILKKGKLQLNFHDGKNILIDLKKPKKDIYNTGDSILLKLPKLKIQDHFKLTKDMTAIITHGQNQGQIVKIKEIIRKATGEPTKIVCSQKDKEFESIKDYIFVIGKTKPVIKLE